MKLSKTINYEITFSIEAFWDEEGGMGQEVFAAGIPDMLEAINALDFANAKGKRDYCIIANVTKK